MRMRMASILAVVAALGLGAGAALASHPVAQLPDGTVVDLNTGIATAPDGHHYKVSPSVLATLREQSTSGGGGSQPPATATASRPAGQPPR